MQSRQRDLFPLPVPAVVPLCASIRRLSRGVRQRVGRRRAIGVEVREAVLSCNLLYSGSWGQSGASAKPSAQQAAAIAYVEECVSAIQPLETLSPQAALRELLGSQATYGGSPCKTAPFAEESLSLPQSAGGFPAAGAAKTRL